MEMFTCTQKNSKISHFVWNLVKEDGSSSQETDSCRNQKRSCDGQSVREVVDGVG